MATTDQEPTLGPARQRTEEHFWRNPLPHLITCLAISALVILAIHLLT